MRLGYGISPKHEAVGVYVALCREPAVAARSLNGERPARKRSILALGNRHFVECGRTY